MIPEFPNLKARSFANLSTDDVRLLDPAKTVLCLPVGSIEQHGPHLPLWTDSLVAQATLDEALGLLDADLPVFALPPVLYGKSNEHNGFPGTMSFSATTLMAVLGDIGRSVRRAGLEKLVFINGHGGNPQVLEIMARDLREECGITVFPLNPGRFGPPEARVPKERGMGIHGGENETSMVLALAPALVKMELAAPSVPTLLDDARLITLEGGVDFGWVSEDVVATGYMGDPTDATAEKGRWIMDTITARLAAVLTEIVSFRPFGQPWAR